MPYLTIDGAAIHYVLDGPAAAPLLVLSNSLGTTLDMWEPQVAQLAAQFRLLRYDTRGHGKSTVGPGRYTIARLGRDVVALLDHLHIERAHMCGLSMGGITGMWLALNHPERIDHLVLSNTAAYIGPASNWTSRVATVQRDGLASIAAAVVSRWLTPGFADLHPERVAGLEAMLKATSAEGYVASCLAVRDSDLRTEVANITTPTLIISGSGDLPTPPSDGRFLNMSIPGSTFMQLDAAHLSNQEQPQRFTDAVRSFLSNT